MKWLNIISCILKFEPSEHYPPWYLEGKVPISIEFKFNFIDTHYIPILSIT